MANFWPEHNAENIRSRTFSFYRNSPQQFFKNTSELVFPAPQIAKTKQTIMKNRILARYTSEKTLLRNEHREIPGAPSWRSGASLHKGLRSMFESRRNGTSLRMRAERAKSQIVHSESHEREGEALRASLVEGAT